MLDLIGSIVGMAAIGINLVAFTGALGGSLARRLGLAAMAGGWVGLATHFAATGLLAFSPNRAVPGVAGLFAVPLLAAGALALGSRRARAALLAVPTSLLIGLNALRVLGVLFLFLAADGRLSGPFPFAAGLGDIVTGAFAIPLALSVARGHARSSTVRSWNLFGALDLVVAIGLGLSSASGSPVHWINVGVGSQAMQYLPFALVPTVLVPFYLVTHALVAVQLASQTRNARPAAPRGDTKLLFAQTRDS
ncbi:MAG TPA: hypothetical protein VLM85_19645 [Polyangiaceae bacterium]|nr:hypothetical protein [Polyangiaceae bacterium]